MNYFNSLKYISFGRLIAFLRGEEGEPMEQDFDRILGEAGDAGLEGASAVRVEELDAVNLQMLLVTSSINHEYSRKELEKCRSYAKKQEILSRMSHLKTLYFAARHQMVQVYPEKLAVLEAELSEQKQQVLSEPVLH